MQKLYLNFHNILSVEINRDIGLSRFFEDRDISFRYGPFLTNKLDYSPDVTVLFKDFKPDTEGCRYCGDGIYVRDKYIYHEFTDKNTCWKAEIANLDNKDATCSIRIYYRTTGSLRGYLNSTFFQFEPVVCMLLRTIIDYRFYLKGYFRQHAAAVAYKNQAFIFSARGSGFKSTISSNLLKFGFEYLGGDVVLVKDKLVYNLPHNFKKYTYIFRHQETEVMNLFQKLKFFVWEILSPFDYKKTDFKVANEVPIKAVFFQNRIKGGRMQIIPSKSSIKANARKLWANNLVDRRTTSFMQGAENYDIPVYNAICFYNSVFTNGPLAKYIDAVLGEYERMLENIATFDLTLPFDYDDSNFSLICETLTKL